MLAIKIVIGVRTRSAYTNGDKPALAAHITDYDRLIVLADEFYSAFREQWMRENKPQGFEAHDIRLGGLVYRIRHCKERIEAYIEGSLSSIEELEETLLDFLGNGYEFFKRPISYNWWQSAALTCVGSI